MPATAEKNGREAPASSSSLGDFEIRSTKKLARLEPYGLMILTIAEQSSIQNAAPVMFGYELTVPLYRGLRRNEDCAPVPK